ncbi:hybrid-cluster NAD(P)-dependent oxidoreductase [Colwellia sp. 12G3]|uniref:hybrid-cluster NAD(P)-dependent oxidoreductase n=1 Tax=Colwellia sp. 12G3 TaxID=2058299 RepID=UPI000C34E719|nr:hybrid-cluster NAD(P)-dependent oxidoreductase [Colwellia sp. 12G3]PKI17247.1 hybrid-cluster NAD(P)-dependent oxidoreductase [Colwellia sp. 12G3]
MALSSTTSTKQTFQLVCQKIETETHDVKTFIFSIPSSQTQGYFNYCAGQHLNFTLDIAGEMKNCCYTLSSSPATPDYVSITIKRIPQGTVSNYFHDDFKVGQSIVVQQVAGSFYLSESVPDKVLLISAGSGITPMLSMLRFMVAKNCSNQVIFVHSAKQEKDLIAQAEISKLARKHGDCQVMYTLTQSSSSHWLGFKGRLNEQMLHSIEQLSDYQTFVCGPKSFRKTVQVLLCKLGLQQKNYHYESFGDHEYSKEKSPGMKEDNKIATPVIESQPVRPQNSKTKISIHFSRWNKQYQGNKQDSLLEQGEAAGLILPYSCRGGCCGSCKAKLISGQVHQNSTDGLSASEQQQGYILLCSCIALTDVEISHE